MKDGSFCSLQQLMEGSAPCLLGCASLSGLSLHHPVSPWAAARAQALTSCAHDSEDETALHGSLRSCQEQTSWIRPATTPTLSPNVLGRNSWGRSIN